MYKLRNPHSGGVKQFQHGFVAKTQGRGDIRLRQQPVNLFRRKVLGQRLLKLGRLDIRRGIRVRRPSRTRNRNRLRRETRCLATERAPKLPVIQLPKKGCGYRRDQPPMGIFRKRRRKDENSARSRR